MITFVASPTGGHIYPAIACAQELGVDHSYFISINSPTGSEIIKRYGFNSTDLPQFRRSLWKIPSIMIKLLTTLLRQRPSVIVLCGGYLCVPVGILAILLRIPIVILEQNVLPGRANKLFSRFAHSFCSSFPGTTQYVKTPCIVTGNPIRKHFPTHPITNSLKNEPWPKTPIIGIFGGSQGARYINDWIQTHYSDFESNSYSTFHITGSRDFETCIHSLDQTQLIKKNGYYIQYTPDGYVQHLLLPYLEDMSLFYHLVSLVISRAGASTISELQHFNVPAITIPYPYAKDNHQTLNALALQSTGLGTTIYEPQLEFSDIKFSLQTLQALEHKHSNSRETIATILKSI